MATETMLSWPGQWQGSDTSSLYWKDFDAREATRLSQGSPNTEPSERVGSSLSRYEADKATEDIFFDTRSVLAEDLMEPGEGSTSNRPRFDIADFLPVDNTDVEHTNWKEYPPPAELLEIPSATSVEIESIIEASIERLQDRLVEEDRRQATEQQTPEETEQPYVGKGKQPEIIEPHHPILQVSSPSNRQALPRQNVAKHSYSSYMNTMDSIWGGPLPSTQTSIPTHRVSKSQDSGYGSASPDNESPKLRTRIFKFGNLLKRGKQTSASTDGASLHSQSTTTISEEKECVSCLDDFDAKLMVPLACHSYCKVCFEELIKAAINSETQWPPKCCLNEIPSQTLLPHLSPKTQKAYNAIFAERSIPAGERVYCSKPSCGIFIPPSNISRDISCANCPSCRTKTCITCRGPHHGTDDCPSDVQLQATMQLAEDEGWKRCYSCMALVEHNQGCIHMTCKCKAQFCYICGLRWRTCGCSDGQLVGVLAAANLRRAAAADREMAEASRAQELNEERRVAEEIRRLEEERQRQEEEELNEILAEIEEFEAREAERLAAEAEVLRLVEEAERKKKVEQRLLKTNNHFNDLRNELEVLHVFQKIALLDRNSEELRTIKANNAAREKLSFEHQVELTIAESAAAATISDSEFRYDTEFMDRLRVERQIEDSYAAQLRDYWRQQPFENAEARVAEAMDAYRKTNASASQKWDEQRKILHQGVVDRANQEVVAVRLRHRREMAAIMGNGLGVWCGVGEGGEMEAKRRAFADERWIEEVAKMREEMLGIMEADEYARDE